MRSTLGSVVAVVVTLVLLAHTVSADDTRSAAASGAGAGSWRGLVDTGLGFTRKYDEPGVCPNTATRVAGALSKLSPNAIGAVMGFTVGAAAGAVATRSALGALRAAFVAGSVGSALGLLASMTPAGERWKTWAERQKHLVELRDREVCGVVGLGGRMRAPVLRHLGQSLPEACDVTPDGVESLDHATGKSLQRCIRDNQEADRVLAEHVPLLLTINQSVCHGAASIVEDYNRLIAEGASDRGRAHGPMPRPMRAECDEATDWAPSRGWASELREVHYF